MISRKDEEIKQVLSLIDEIALVQKVSNDVGEK
jgi:hypothetical protein